MQWANLNRLALTLGMVAKNRRDMLGIGSDIDCLFLTAALLTRMAMEALPPHSHKTWKELYKQAEGYYREGTTVASVASLRAFYEAVPKDQPGEELN